MPTSVESDPVNQIDIISRTTDGPKVYQSRFGYHPCSYETYLMLKALNQYRLRAWAQFKSWKRWRRKSVRNRVIRQGIYNKHGQRIGAKIVGVAAEPVLNSCFVRIYYGDSLLDNCCDPTECFTGQRFRFMPRDIEADYRRARTPAATPEQAERLTGSIRKYHSLPDALREQERILV